MYKSVYRIYEYRTS